MPPPNFMEGPNTVQTSLYGYDKSKRVQFQMNSLRGKPILVLRGEPAGSKAQFGGGSKFSKKWIDRSNHMPQPVPNKPMYPSYTHFHHQYSSAKQTPIPPISLPSTPTIPPGRSAFFPQSPHRKGSRRPPFSPISRFAPTSPKSLEEEMTVKRLFDKLEVSTPPPTSSSSSFANITSDITLLELHPKTSAKTFITTPICVSDTETTSASPDSSNRPSLLDTPKSLSESNRTCSETTRLDSETTDDEQSSICTTSRTAEKTSRHICPDEAQCIIFRNGVCADDVMERQNMIQWYNELIQWRHEVVTRRCFGPPRCHPPPLTVTIIGASRAQRANSFQRIGNIHPFQMEAMDHVRRRMDAKKSNRLVPADLPLPAPHEFMANAKCMEPHLFIEYCYQLTAAAYMDTGLNPPSRRPPIPPRIDPIQQHTSRESICSSASEFSSDGEYSDDSDDTKAERLRQKMERHRKRERRLQRIFQRREVLDEIDEADDN
ncbi:hypothetical protein B9Z55_001256 [Caenorhabditis nigoni]|uniref:Uncharacterized protein n=1 Tax=Caenorhabditis nigoni TaxID=1611254 RepID=A0A2G5VF38_9PELO|nr:hypothetical protein B9Z55_001256 [Caenorhabditis nigoni]